MMDKLSTEKHHNLHSSPDIFRGINRAWKPEVKRPIERTIIRCEDNIQVGLREQE
jgi:hypothetical protein